MDNLDKKELVIAFFAAHAKEEDVERYRTYSLNEEKYNANKKWAKHCEENGFSGWGASEWPYERSNTDEEAKLAYGKAMADELEKLVNGILPTPDHLESSPS